MLLRHVVRIAMVGCIGIVPGATAIAEPQALPVPHFEGTGEAGTGSFAFRLGYYDNDDQGDGNPFLDEALTVIEPIAVVDYNITDRFAVFGKFSYDSVSSASIERLSEFDNQSGASGDYYYGLDLGARYELTADRRIGGFVNGSIEYDYRSIGFGADFAQDLGQKDTTVKVALNGFFDRVDVIRFDGTEDGTDDRVSFSSTLSWYQVLNRRAHAEAGARFGLQTGFLETAFNAVVIEDPSLPENSNLDNRARGREVEEVLPDTRLRGSLFGRGRYSLRRDTALELGGRLFLDDWGIFSLTIEPRVHHWFENRLGLRLGYRFYTQTAPDDYDDHFTSEKSKRTQDSDLAGFDAHGIRGGLTWRPWASVGIDFDAGYTFREDGIDQLTLSLGILKSFDAKPLGRMLWRR